MKKVFLGMGLLALCSGMMACAEVDCAKEHEDCVAACTGEDTTACKATCDADKVKCEDTAADNECKTPLIINEVNVLKGAVDYNDVGEENCLTIATNVTAYLSTNKAALQAAVTDWSAYESGDALCKTLNAALTGLAVLNLYTVYNSIETCQTSLAGSGVGETLTMLDSAIQGLGTIEGIQAALQAGAAAAGAAGAGK